MTTSGAASNRMMGLGAIDITNPNIWSSASVHLEVSSADIATLQESRTRVGDRTMSSEDQANRKGWNASTTPALDTEAVSTAACDGIACRTILGMSKPATAM